MAQNTPQFSFIPSSLSLIDDIDVIAKKDNRSRSKTISLLLEQAVKERNRKKLAKQKGNTKHNSADPR